MSIRSDDYLGNLPVEQVAAFYQRLVDLISKKRIKGQKPLSAILLQEYINNRDPKYIYKLDPPNYLKGSKYILDVLKYHRDVFLTIQKARIGKKKIWAGIKPRITGQSGFVKWNFEKNLEMNYESLVEVGSGYTKIDRYADIARIMYTGDDTEKDLFTSLRGFQLKSKVIVKGIKISEVKVNIKFVSWLSSIKDKYDFNYNEHLTLPNPDYKSTNLNAVRPDKKKIRIYHSNAKRMEDKNLAKPFFIESKTWPVTKENIIKSHDIIITPVL